jgi:hypothetical protein
MQYNLTHRGQVIATFDTADMDPIEADELRRIRGDFFKIVPTKDERLPDLMHSNLADVKPRGKGFTCGRNYGRPHSTRATSWL